ncbi:MAG: hypothetical protein PF692_11830 [Kiritimatiellae bacterium]|jgi:hypothetical protein|nr:hypothetical protein [Kiritimatiellia bacterium]
MTAEEIVERVIKHGAMIYVWPPQLNREELLFPLGGVMWLEDPMRIRWSQTFPEDQHHVHEAEYDEVRIENDMEVMFFKDGLRAANILPHEKADCKDDLTEHFAEWHRLLNAHNNQTNFSRFMDEAM